MVVGIRLFNMFIGDIGCFDGNNVFSNANRIINNNHLVSNEL